MPIGLTLPFAHTTSSLGYLSFSTTELQAAYYNLKSLLLTNWGERPNHFYLGCNLAEFLFEPVGDETEERIKERIESQVSSWLPYIELTDIDVSFSSDNGLKLRIKFNMRSRLDMNSVIEVTINQ